MSNESTVLRDKVYSFVELKAKKSVLQFGIESKRTVTMMKSMFDMYKDMLDINSIDKIGASIMIYYPTSAYTIKNQDIENALSIDVANIVKKLLAPTASIQADREMCFAFWLLELFSCQMNKLFDSVEFETKRSNYAMMFRNVYYRQDLMVLISTVDSLYLYSEESVSISSSTSHS